MGKPAIDDMEPYELTPDQDAKATRMIEEAESDLAPVRIGIRWRKAEVDLVKQAAERYGMPYQTYIKQAALRKAIEDLKASEGIATAKRRKRA